MRALRGSARTQAPQSVEPEGAAAGRGSGVGLGLVALALVACFDAKSIVFTDELGNAAVLDAGVAAAQPAAPLPPSAPVATGSDMESAEALPVALDVPQGEVNMAAPGAVPVPVPAVDAGPAPVLPVVADCALPSLASGAALFSGVPNAGVCPTTLDAPYAMTWYSYQDSGDALTLASVAPGCVADACALRVDGPPPGAAGYASFGAGVALPLSTGGVPFDGSAFDGFQFWVRGTLAGTRGPGAVDAPQTLFTKLVTSTNRQGDDFGVYCRIDPSQWTLCRGDFGSLVRDGFAATPDPASDVLDLQNILRVEIEFRLYRDPLGVVPVPVSVAAEFASVSFF
jgi:hypothetical protein